MLAKPIVSVGLETLTHVFNVVGGRHRSWFHKYINTVPLLRRPPAFSLVY